MEPNGLTVSGYKRVEEQILAMSVSEVGRVTTDVAMASSNALGRARESGVAAFPSSGSSPTVERP